MDHPSHTSSPPRALTGRSLLIAAVIGLAIAGFHLLGGRAVGHSVLLESFNWLFDFDSSRFVGGWCTPGADVMKDIGLSFAPRHALSLAIRPLCLGLNAFVGSPQQSLMVLTALCAGCAAALAYCLAASFCAREFDRVVLALGYAVSVHPLTLGVIPEAYGFALMGIGLHMVLLAQHRPLPLPKRPLAVLSLVLNLGFTVTNGALNLISSAVLSWQRMSLRAWLTAETKTWLWAILALALVALPAAALFAPVLLTEAVTAAKYVWWVININRGEPATLLTVVYSFFFYSFVAPTVTVLQLPAPDGHAMIDFRQFSYTLTGGIALALWTGAMLTSIVYAWRDALMRRLLVVVGCWLLMNIVLHWYWQYRGSVYLYGAHTSFPLYAVLVMGYASALGRHAVWPVRAVALATVVLTAINNLGLYAAMIDFVVQQPLTPG